MSTIRKQIPLRLSKALYEEIAAWAADEFRSVNAQIEYLLTESVRTRRKKFSDEEIGGVKKPGPET